MGAAFQTTAPTFTRPANTTAYADTDLVADNVTAGSVVPLIFPRSKMRGRTSGKVIGASIYKSTVTATNCTLLLHLFTQAKTLTNGDNGAFVVSNLAGYIGSISVDLATGGQAIAGGPLFKRSAAVALGFTITSGGNLYGYLEAKAAYTPASAETFTVAIDIEA